MPSQVKERDKENVVHWACLEHLNTSLGGFISQALNISTSQLWHTVAMSETGEEFTTPVG